MLRTLSGTGSFSLRLASSGVSSLGRYGKPAPRFAQISLATPRLQTSPILSYALNNHARTFRTSAPRKFPFCWTLLLKASSSIQIAETTFRIALTFLPLSFCTVVKGKKVLEKIDKMIQQGRTDLANKRVQVIQRLICSRKVIKALLTIPTVVLALIIFSSYERTPLTGRWRMITLSPEEEDDIARQLAGVGWYSAVMDILSQDGPPRLIDPTDWRFVWVRDTLRRLESAIPMIHREHELFPNWMEEQPDGIPRPPPAKFPLRPGPRAHRFADSYKNCEGEQEEVDVHTAIDPPYSLLVVDRPEASNAFSYGFGPDGAGGIVVFSGFLNNVLAKYPFAPEQAQPEPSSGWSSFFGTFSRTPSQHTHPIPTEEQTSELAILLAHELSHLVLAHHIETLSTGSIFWPSMSSIVTDFVRVILFPFTMIMGPFMNDAVANVTKTCSTELAEIGEYRTSQEQEVEADIVSARLLAHAGFDPRHAVRFWENRKDTADNAECAAARIEDSLVRRWTGSTHPMSVVRVQRLKRELDRWEQARVAARRAMQQKQAGADDAWLVQQYVRRLKQGLDRWQ